MDWAFSSLELREPLPHDGMARNRGCAIGGRGLPPPSVQLLTDVPLPERLLIGHIPVEGRALTVVSYHAPPSKATRSS